MDGGIQYYLDNRLAIEESSKESDIRTLDGNR